MPLSVIDLRRTEFASIDDNLFAIASFISTLGRIPFGCLLASST